MWSQEQIERLKKYVDANRYFQVFYHKNQVYGMDIPEDKDYSPCIYLEKYEDTPPDTFFSFDEFEPSDITVKLLRNVDWENEDPNTLMNFC